MHGSTNDDLELIVEAARGSREAFGHLYDRHAVAVATVARRFLGGEADVDDLVHDVFLEAWQRAGDYDPERGSVRAWLLVRTRSRCLDRRKSPANARRSALSEETSGEAGAADRLDWLLDGARVRSALARLPDDQRATILLGYCEGLSSSEIASKLSIPIGTVKSRVHAAMQKLRDELAERHSITDPDHPRRRTEHEHEQ